MDLHKNAIEALAFLAVGNYNMITDYKDHKQIVIGQSCMWCTYNTVEAKKYHKNTFINYNQHRSYCPTTKARAALSAHKIQMSSWKVTYALVEDQTEYDEGVRSKIRSFCMPSPEKPTSDDIIKRLAEMVLLENEQAYVINVVFVENIGYKPDNVA